MLIGIIFSVYFNILKHLYCKLAKTINMFVCSQLLQSEELERKKERILTELSTLLKPQSPAHGTLDFKIPQTPICGSSVNRKHQGKHTKTPPRASTHKLINLSFSQPATPRTPFSSVDKCVSATPMHPTQTYQP